MDAGGSASDGQRWAETTQLCVAARMPLAQPRTRPRVGAKLFIRGQVVLGGAKAVRSTPHEVTVSP